MYSTSDKVIVIGAGMGGLASAIRLAHAGCDVTLLEAQSGPGGKMRTLPSAAGPVDTGPTVMTLRPIFEALFDDVDARLSDHVTLHRETVLARHWWADGSTLDLHADPESSVDAVRAFAGPREAEAFAAFSAQAAKLFAAFDQPMMQEPSPDLAGLTRHVLAQPSLIPAMGPLTTLAKSLSKRFRDPRLQQLFGRYATYVGGSPYAAPAVLALIWQAEAQGVWRVEGGMHALAQALAKLATEKGAELRYDSPVARIETQSGRVSGVHLTDGTRLQADTVVFNGDPRALHLGLLGPAPRPAVPAPGVQDRSLSAYVWSFAATPSGRDLVHHNVFFADDPQVEFDALAAGQMPPDATLYLCAEDRGAGLAPNGAERFEVIMNGPPVLNEASAGNDEEEFRKCQTQVFNRFAAMGLDFSERPGRSALTMPRDFARLFPGSAGSLYGRSPHGLMAAFQRPQARTKLPGLYLAGGGAHPGAGIPMATLSGRHAAAAILQDRTSTSTSRRMATHGGISTGSAPAAPARSP
ncbi:1-hydroxycarotenoid 3,4-desaturase CrtD [Dinoroseobacter sp. S124A]|uniref:1-hydroxycarotenoid 3,4-desaturase CrtD n=1 Tax=Dinoroseobacter sp. S124A TaxID=3415128 RepID=UPI003C7A97C1